MELALFDLDNTLLTGDSDHAWAEFLIGLGVLDRETFQSRNRAFYEQYKAGCLNIQEYLAWQLGTLATLPRSQLDKWREQYVENVIRPLIPESARQLIKQHQAQGHLLAIVTATNSFVTGPIAREFGVEHLIGTIPAQQNGQFTGQTRGLPAFQAGKIARTESWLESLGYYWGSFEKAWFYSDSHNDLPLLSHVSHPVAVNPDSQLLKHAQEHNWPVLKICH